MNRLALRLSAKAALLGGGRDNPWITIAQNRVYDSRQDDIDANIPEGRRAVIIIRTDNDERAVVTPNGATSRSVELRFQFGIMQAAKDEEGTMLVGWPTTESGLESFLDLLEWQIETALIGNGIWADFFKSLWGASPFVSTPLFANDPEEGRVRMAAREIVMKFDGFPADDVPPMLKTSDPNFVPKLGDMLVSVFERVAGQGKPGSELVQSFARLRSDLEAQSLPDADRFPLLRIVKSKIYVVDSRREIDDERPDFVTKWDFPLPETES